MISIGLSFERWAIASGGELRNAIAEYEGQITGRGGQQEGQRQPVGFSHQISFLAMKIRIHTDIHLGLH